MAHGLVHAHAEVEVGDGLDDEVERVDLVAAHGVLGEVGHKDDGGHLVVGAQEVRGLHAVDAGHLDVHEHEVEALLGELEVHGVGEAREREVEPALLRIAVEKRRERVSSVEFVLDECDSVHVPSPSPLPNTSR